MRQMPNTNREVEETTTNKGMEETNTNEGLEGGQMGEESFVFVTNYLVGAVLGKKEWGRYKFCQWVTKHFTETDEAFLYVILLNLYDLWKTSDGTKVGAGILTKDGLNKKYCGCTKQGIKAYNKILEKVRANCKASWAQNVEDKVMETPLPKLPFFTLHTICTTPTVVHQTMKLTPFGSVYNGFYFLFYQTSHLYSINILAHQASFLPANAPLSDPRQCH
jgi:hypothetical protein